MEFKNILGEKSFDTKAAKEFLDELFGWDEDTAGLEQIVGKQGDLLLEAILSNDTHRISYYGWRYAVWSYKKLLSSPELCRSVQGKYYQGDLLYCLEQWEEMQDLIGMKRIRGETLVYVYAPDYSQWHDFSLDRVRRLIEEELLFAQKMLKKWGRNKREKQGL